MPRKFKWENVESSFGNFYSNYSPQFVLAVKRVVSEASLESTKTRCPECLVEAIKKINVPRNSSDPTCKSYVFWNYDMSSSLAMVAKLLWFRHAPTDELVEQYAASNNIPREDAFTKLCDEGSKNLVFNSPMLGGS